MKLKLFISYDEPILLRALQALNGEHSRIKQSQWSLKTTTVLLPNHRLAGLEMWLVMGIIEWKLSNAIVQIIEYIQCVKTSNESAPFVHRLGARIV
jgi:hypothetical protein